MDRVQIGALVIGAALLVVSFLLQPQAPPEPEPGAAPPRAEALATSERAPGVETLPPVPGGAPAVPESPGTSPASERVIETALDGEIVELSNDALVVRVNTAGAILQDVLLPGFRDRVEEPGDPAGPVQLATVPGRGLGRTLLGEGPLRVLDTVRHEIVTQDSRRLELRATADGVIVTRSIELDDAGYGARVTVRVENAGSGTVRPRFGLSWQGRERPSGAPDRFQNFSLIASADGIERQPVSGIGSPGFFGGLFGGGSAEGTVYPPPVEWAGIDSQYFMAVGIAENPRESSAFFGPLGSDHGRAVLSYPPFDVPPGTQVARTWRLYMGPKVVSEVAAVDARLDPALDVGWAVFRPLVDLFAVALHWTYENVYANYGVAIILLTILLRAVTYPLTQRSMKSMKRLQVIAPEMKAIQEKYADDREKQQAEIMALYRQKGMNPLSAVGGGCLPMLLQMPFMIALYFALQSAIDLRHAPFMLWIDDLSAPEDFMTIAGLPIRVLPLLMGASMIIQQRMTPTPNADPQQRQMMTMMSVVFIFLFYQFPSGLVLYWFVSNLLGIAQQVWVNKQPAAEAAVPSKTDRKAEPKAQSKGGDKSAVPVGAQDAQREGGK